MKRLIICMVIIMISLCLPVYADNVLFNVDDITSDLAIRSSPAENHWGTIIRWNVSNMPENSESITNAELCLYILSSSGSMTNPLNIIHFYDSWTELTAVAQLDIMINNYENDSVEVNASAFLSGDYMCLDITSQMIEVFNNNYTNISFMIIDPDNLLSGFNIKSDSFLRIGNNINYVDFEDRENNGASGNFSYINLSYDPFPETIIYIDSPDNITYYTQDISLDWYALGTFENCTYSLDGDVGINISDNITLINLSYAQHNFSITCEDLISLNQSISPMIWFTIKEPCTEDWRPIYSDCINGLMMVTYEDLGNCNTTENISYQSPKNATRVDCTGNSLEDANFILTFKKYPYFLLSDNPQYIFIDIFDDEGIKVSEANVTVNFTSERTGNSTLFHPVYNSTFQRYELYVNYSEEDVGDNYTIITYTDIAELGNALSFNYVRQHTCQILYRLWNDKNQSSYYDNDFGQIIARPLDNKIRYSILNHLMGVSIWDNYVSEWFDIDSEAGLFGSNFTRSDFKFSKGEWFHAKYEDGVANLTLYDSGAYQIKFIDGNFVFPNNYGRYLIERSTIDTDIGSYNIICNPDVTQIRDYYVSRFDLKFFDTLYILMWLSLFILGSGILAFITLYLTGSIRLAVGVFIGILAVLVSVFFGVNVMKVLF